jgi:DNA replication protein DnaC
VKLQFAGGTVTLKPLSDEEFASAKRVAPRSLDVCPTCDGRERTIPGAGMKRWESDGYWRDQENHACDCQAQIALYTRYVLANIGTQYQRLDWEQFAGTKEADTMVRKYIATWSSFLAHGFGLTFSSKVQGVGKTWAATHIGKELIKQRQRVYFLDFVQMVDAFCGDYQDKQTVERRMRETTLLILDDVRAGVSERQTDLYALKFEVVMRHRTNFDLPTILTTNLTEEEFEAEFPRIHSLIAPKQLWINMYGVDHRKRSATAVHTAEMIARGEINPIT